MTSTATPIASTAIPSMKDAFLSAYDREHAITMKVLRAYPTDKLELRPAEKCKSAKELAWVFALERGLAQAVFRNALASGMPAGSMPSAPDTWDGVLGAIEKGHEDFGNLVRSMADAELSESVKFFTAPKTMGDVRRIDFAWFLLHDEIHHRGQFSIYARMAGGKLPSIYGPTADEPWM